MANRYIFGLGVVVAMLATQVSLAQTQPRAAYRLYVQADVSMARDDWQDFADQKSWKFITNGRSGMSYGLVAGWQLFQHFSVETGFDVLPTTSFLVGNHQYNISSYLVFADGKLSIPVTMHVDLNAKAGFAYRSLDNSLSNVGSGQIWDPIFGVGVDYNFSKVFRAGLGYMHIPGNFSGDTAGQAPNLNTYSLTAAYKFTI